MLAYRNSITDSSYYQVMEVDALPYGVNVRYGTVRHAVAAAWRCIGSRQTGPSGGWTTRPNFLYRAPYLRLMPTPTSSRWRAPSHAYLRLVIPLVPFSFLGALRPHRNLARLHSRFEDEQEAEGAGVLREWLSQIAADLFSPERGLFVRGAEDGRMVHPAPHPGLLPPAAASGTGARRKAAGAGKRGQEVEEHLGYMRFAGRIVGKQVAGTRGGRVWSLVFVLGRTR